MIDLQEIGTGAAGIWIEAAMGAWGTSVLPHFPPCDDDMEVPAVEEYKKYFRATMLAWGMLATRGMVGVKVKSNPPTIDECIEAVCSYFKHPIEWETVLLIAVYDAAVKYDLLKAMSKLNRLEIAGELDGHTVLETVAALNRKYHGSVERGGFSQHVGKDDFRIGNTTAAWSVGFIHTPCEYEQPERLTAISGG